MPANHSAALASPRRSPRPLPRRLTPWRRAKRIAVITFVLCAVPTTISFVTTMTSPSNSSFTIRSFEWLRDHGAAGIASSIEGFYYTLTAPSTGGSPLRALPLKVRVPVVSAVHPPNVAPVLTPSLPGEGVWSPTETWTAAGSPVLITQFRSDPNYPQMVAGVAWINMQTARIAWIPGRQEPPVSLPRGSMEVPTDTRARLLATFNSAFKLSDSGGGGIALAGQTYAPLRPGLATFVGYGDGRVDIQSWAGGSIAPSNVIFARQNLPLIVEGGRPNPNLSDGPEWGATLGNAVRVWRSGVGVDARGNLIYAAANDQTVGSLAAILIRAGAVRAMELDINSYWVTFNSYGQQFAGNPSRLLPGMTRGTDRYLTPDDRDFFAVYAK